MQRTKHYSKPTKLVADIKALCSQYDGASTYAILIQHKLDQLEQLTGVPHRVTDDGVVQRVTAWPA